MKLGCAANNRNGWSTGFASVVGVAPFPGKDRESWAWLLDQDGPVIDVETRLARCTYFSPTEADALAVLAEVVTAVAAWR